MNKEHHIDNFPGAYIYGNKGAMWENKAHLSGLNIPGETLCGTPMLATNHVRLNGIEEVGCEKCRKAYKALTVENGGNN